MFSFFINIISFFIFEVIDLTEEIVVPGDFLSVEEEFVAGKNTFEDNEGNIYSTVVGRKDFNQPEREVSVKKNNSLNKAELGSIITGKVHLIKDPVVVLNILKIEKDGKEVISSFSSAQLMIANVAREHIKFLRDMFRVGDIVKAKVIKITKFGMDVTTQYPELGVIKAYCSNCRNPMELYGKTLKCPKCGSVETRKLSREFK